MKKFFSTILFLLAGMASYAQEAPLSVDDIKIVPDQNSEIVANITGAQNFIGSGLYITLPNGFSFVYDEEEDDYFVGGSVFAKTHSISSNFHADNVAKIAIVSMKNATFKTDEGTLFSTTIHCPADAKIGDKFQGALQTIEFSKTDNGGLFTTEDVTFGIEVTTADAIDAIDADEAVSEVYSVSGAQQNGLQKGVNIVKYANGEVKKVVVK